MEVIILGSANAVPVEGHENTHFLVREAGRAVLVDCAGTTLVQITKSGVAFDEIEHLILTHFHPDHVGGAPTLLMGLWLLGRHKKLVVHGLKYTLDRFKTLMDLFDYKSWPGFYELQFHEVSATEQTLLLQEGDLRVVASPVDHLIPNIGLRFESLSTGKCLAYSSDTSPSDSVVRLSKDCDVLLHEAAGDSKGHSSAAGAGEIAARAGAGVLYLIHYPPETENLDPMLAAARKHFARDVTLATDLMHIQL